MLICLSLVYDLKKNANPKLLRWVGGGVEGYSKQFSENIELTETFTHIYVLELENFDENSGSTTICSKQDVTSTHGLSKRCIDSSSESFT